MSPRHTRILDAAILLLFCGIIAIARWHTYTEPADWDIGTYAVIGHELNSGQLLYSDIWDVKPPLVYLSYALAEKITGYGLGEIYFLALLTACGTMLGIWYAASVAGRTSGLIAAAAYTIVGGDLHLQANRANTEAFINLYLVWGFAVLLRSGSRRAISKVVTIGVLFALATLYKQVAIAPIVAVLFTHGLTPPAGSNRKMAVRDALGILGFVAGIWLATFAYFMATQRGGIFWITSFIYPRFYGGSAIANFYASLHLEHLFPAILYPLLPCAMLTLVTLVWPTGDPRAAARSRAILLAMMIGAQLAIGMLQQFFDHYYQFWLVPISIGSGWGAAALLEKVRSRRLAALGIGLAIIGMLWVQIPFYRLSAAQWSEEKNSTYHTRGQLIGRELGQLLSPDETFFDWSENNAWLYFVSQRRPPGPGLWRAHMREGPMATLLTERTLDRLRARPPKMVVEWFHHHMDEDHPITRWIVANYEVLNDGVDRYPFVLMKRKD